MKKRRNKRKMRTKIAETHQRLKVHHPNVSNPPLRLQLHPWAFPTFPDSPKAWLSSNHKANVFCMKRKMICRMGATLLYWWADYLTWVGKLMKLRLVIVQGHRSNWHISWKHSLQFHHLFCGRHWSSGCCIGSHPHALLCCCSSILHLSTDSGTLYGPWAVNSFSINRHAHTVWHPSGNSPTV